MTIAAQLLRRWLPVAVFAIFALGVLFSWPAHGQTPSPETNAIEIASVKSEVRNLSDITVQIPALRDRVMAIELKQTEQGKQLEGIGDLEKWIVLGVFGILGTQILNKFRFGWGRDSGDNDRRTLFRMAGRGD